MSKVQLQHYGPHWISLCSHLQHLHLTLEHREIDSKSHRESFHLYTEPMLQHKETLSSLLIGDFQLSSQDIDQISQLPHLKKLHIYANERQYLICLPQIKQLTQLTDLTVQGQRMQMAEAEAYAHLTNLTALDLSCGKEEHLDPHPGLGIFLTSLTQLTSLNLNHKHFSTADAKTLAECQIYIYIICNLCHNFDLK